MCSCRKSTDMKPTISTMFQKFLLIWTIVKYFSMRTVTVQTANNFRIGRYIPHFLILCRNPSGCQLPDGTWPLCKQRRTRTFCYGTQGAALNARCPCLLDLFQTCDNVSLSL